jgi:hypothetical protein
MSHVATFSRLIRAFIAGNPNLLVFLVGFTVFSWAVGTYSVPLAGMCGGVILMTIAVYPFLIARKG